MKVYCVWLKLILWPIAVCSQVFPLRSFSVLHFDERDGLTASDIYGVTQDSSGYLWVGTSAGLFRFDGHNFRSYGEEEISGPIIRMIPMAGNRLLILADQPRTQYVLHEHTLQEVAWAGGDRTSPSRVAWDDDRARIYFLDHLNVQLIEKDTSTYLRAYSTPKLAAHAVTFAQDSLYLFTKKKGYMVIHDGELATRIIPGYHNERIVEVLEDDTGSLWCIGENHLFQWGSMGWEKRAYHGLADSGQEMEQAVWDKQGRLWISGQAHQLFVFDLRTGETRRVDKLLGIENVQVTYLFRDRDDNLWVSTAGHGLLCLPQRVFPRYTIQDGLSGNYITALKKSRDGNLWVGSNSGVTKMILDTQGTLDYTIPVLSIGYLQDLLEQENGTLLYAYSGPNKIKPLNTGQIPVRGLWGRSIEPIGSSEYVLGRWLMMAIGMPDTTKSIGFKLHKVYRVEGRAVGHFLWKGDTIGITSKHLYRLGASKKGIPITSHQHNEQTVFYDFEKGPDGSYWIASSDGVYRFQDSLIRVLTSESGLPSERCFSLTYDGTDSWWIGTDRGLCRYDGNEVRVFTQGSGLPSNYITKLLYDSTFQCLWVGTSKGLSQISYSYLDEQSTTSFPLHIQQLEVIGDTLFLDPKGVTLTSKQNHLRVSFTSVNYTSPGYVEYQYRLEGKQADWITSQQNRAEYLALAPGSYRFLVRSRISGASWGPVTTMEFEIQSPWWLRWYTWFGAALLFLMLVAIAVRWRVQRIRTQESEKRQTLVTINELEQQVLQSSMNPHFLFNSLNSIQGLFGKHNDPEAINYVAEFAALVRSNMEAVRKKAIRLADEVDQLERYLNLEAYRLQGRLTYDIQVESDLPLHSYEIPPMLVQPFVENAIWHGIAPAQRPGKVTVTFQLTASDQLRICVEDDGVGFQTASNNGTRTHISRGIQLIRDRLQMLPGENELNIEQRKDAQGARVTLSLYLE